MIKEVGLACRRNVRVLLVAACLVMLIVAVVVAIPQLPREQAAAASWFKVDYQTLENRLGLVGRIEAAMQQTMSSPFDGLVSDVSVKEGQRVERGQRLLSLDTTQLDIQLRSALAEQLIARRNVLEVEGWSQGQEVARAKRTLSSVQSTLADNERRLAETKVLLAQGIVPRMELETVEQQVRSQRLDLSAAQSELGEVLKKGGEEHLQIARMQWTNAQSRYQSLLEQREQRDVLAPFAGVVIRSRTPQGNGANLPFIQKGQRVGQGVPLFELINIEQVQVVARVEESDVHQLHAGLPVEITGDGFDGVVLHGQIESVGVQGIDAQAMPGGAFYEVIASIQGIESEQLRRLRLGMSARLQIVTYHRDRGIVVPLEALSSDSEGRSVVTYRSTLSEKPGEVVVTTGRTMPNGIEVEDLEPGYVELRPLL
ncbi:HlyD family efflux transporter periplasmic adaptor subunit [Pseudomonas alliivorans]|nr:HlyD family efflux transporter periplasmic adaptor subunit [Pseudomonas alliivorans]